MHVEQYGELLGDGDHPLDEVAANMGAKSRGRLYGVGGNLQHLADGVEQHADLLLFAIAVGQRKDCDTGGGLDRSLPPTKADRKVDDRHHGAPQVDDPPDKARHHGHRRHPLELDDLADAADIDPV